MDQNRVEGRARTIGGKLKDMWGRLTGSPGYQVRGKVDQAAGKVQEQYGRLKDEVRAEERRDESGRPGRL
jgi:uncharacterized protein YjbJ (UPF0337 family)